MTVLLLKVLLAPTLVVASSLAGRRWGAGVAGILVALPVVAGPILVITYLEHGSGFGARSAAASLLGLVSLTLFAVMLALTARRLPWVAALLISWAACLLADVALAHVHVAAFIGFLVVLAGRAAAVRLLQTTVSETAPVTPSWPWWDLPGRALATAGLVVAVTSIAATVGPSMTGVLAPFPIATSVVAAFVLAQQGTVAAAATLRGVLRGLLGFAVFCLTVALLLRPAGASLTFAAATLAALTVQAAATQADFGLRVVP